MTPASQMYIGSAQPIAEPVRVMPPEVQRAYENYLRGHFGEIDVLSLAEVMFRAGGRTAIENSVAFADLLPTLRRMEARIGALADALEAALRA